MRVLGRLSFRGYVLLLCHLTCCKQEKKWVSGQLFVLRRIAAKTYKTNEGTSRAI